MFDLDDYLPYLCHRATVRVGAAFQAEAKAVGVTIEKWRVMAALHNFGEQSISSAARRTSIEISTLSHLLRRMERDGLVERVGDATDGRVKRIRFTAKGEALTMRLLPLVLHLERFALDGFSDQEAAQLKSMLKRVNENLGRLTGDDFAPIIASLSD